LAQGWLDVCSVQASVILFCFCSGLDRVLLSFYLLPSTSVILLGSSCGADTATIPALRQASARCRQGAKEEYHLSKKQRSSSFRFIQFLVGQSPLLLAAIKTGSGFFVALWVGRCGVFLFSVPHGLDKVSCFCL
jgi:hypothetical protein